jgi:dedicator of cytokinesis protein 3
MYRSTEKILTMISYGDMRISVCTLIKNLWNKVDTQNFARNLIKEFLKISIINQVELKELGVKLYFSALEREYKLVKSFKGIEGQTIEAFSMSVGSSSSFTFFFNTLEKYVNASISKEFVESASKFLSDMKELCLHLIALNKSQKGQNEDDRTIATLSLMEYLKESNRIGTYIRYVHSLVEQHSRSNNFLKAGLTILLHTNLLSWSSDVKSEFQKETDLEKKVCVSLTFLS